MIDVTVIPTLKDNYSYLLQKDGETAVVDPGAAAPVIAALQERSLKLDYIFNTHHHSDHTAGNIELKQKYGAKLAGPRKESVQIAGLDILLDAHSEFSLGGEKMSVIETPGHTSGHTCLYFSETGIVFTGDTLFLMGCGRLLEGTAKQMWNSLQALSALPGETKIYCGHEYTLSNGKFCLQVEPDNKDLQLRLKEVMAMREKGLPTMPGTIALEKKTNAFLRAGSLEKFTEIRKLKDQS